MLAILTGTGTEQRIIDEIGAGSFEPIEVETPFGDTSQPVLMGEIDDGRRLALLSRHAPGHRLPPHAIPVRANIFALRTLGVTHIISTGAVGSLREGIEPGQLALPDQLIDRTTGPPVTFFDRVAVHVEFADPFCPVLRRALSRHESACATSVHDRATYVCINGPTFATRAESELHRQWGADLVGMTAAPEARLAREAGIGYALIAMPTDYDCWRSTPAQQPEVSLLTEIRANLQRAADAAFALIRAVLQEGPPIESIASPASRALDQALWSDPESINDEYKASLGPLWKW